jgi:hypothetical protein
MSLGRRRPSSASVSLTSGPSEQIRALYSHYTKDSTSQGSGGVVECVVAEYPRCGECVLARLGHDE